jgi:acyl-CoA synthetase (AMP-forming)/AMP-acid ligase II
MQPHDLDDRPGRPGGRGDVAGRPARSYARRPPTVLDVLDRAVRRWPDVDAFVDVDGTTCVRGVRGRVETAAAALARAACLPARRWRWRPATRSTSPRPSSPAPGQVWSWWAQHAARPAAVDVHAGALAGALRSRARRTSTRCPARAAGGRAARGEPAAVGLHPAEQPREDATYAVVYTSGTTGRPKASQVVHRCSVHSGMSYQRVLQLGPDDVTAVLFPMYYISAMHAHVLPAMLAGRALRARRHRLPARVRRGAARAPRVPGPTPCRRGGGCACACPASPTCRR